MDTEKKTSTPPSKGTSRSSSVASKASEPSQEPTGDGQGDVGDKDKDPTPYVRHLTYMAELFRQVCPNICQILVKTTTDFFPYRTPELEDIPMSSLRSPRPLRQPPEDSATTPEEEMTRSFLKMRIQSCRKRLFETESMLTSSVYDPLLPRTYQEYLEDQHNIQMDDPRRVSLYEQ